MPIAEKSYFLHERNEKGELKPITIEVEKGVEIKIIPIPEGEISALATKKGYDVISDHIVEPKISPEEIQKYGRNGRISKVVEKLIEASDIRQSFRNGQGSESKAFGGADTP